MSNERTHTKHWHLSPTRKKRALTQYSAQRSDKNICAFQSMHLNLKAFTTKSVSNYAICLYTLSKCLSEFRDQRDELRFIWGDFYKFSVNHMLLLYMISQFIFTFKVRYMNLPFISHQKYLYFCVFCKN